MIKFTKLHDLAAYLKQAAGTYLQHDYELLYQELHARYEQQVMEALLEKYPGWGIVTDDAACYMYLYRNWSLSKEANENARKFIDLAKDLFENYGESKELFFTINIVENVMRVVEQVYDFSKYVLKNRHMFIFLFPSKYRYEDSFCRCFKGKNDMNYADIYILTPKKDNQATPQSILLHELGHMVNLVLTGDVGKLPKDFAVITSLLNLNFNKNDQNEFFAHCFAMSLLSETELVPFDPFPMVPQTHKILFRFYFTYKINNLK